MNRDVQECDATTDAMKTEVGPKIKTGRKITFC